ncbi:MAG: JAB domain-containing protein [Crocinitomicaceae bacterium]
MSRQLSLFEQSGSTEYGSDSHESLTQIFQKNYRPPEVNLIFDPPKSIISNPTMTSSKDVEKIFRRHWPKGKMGLQEHFYMMMLNRNNAILGISQIGIGGTAYVPIDLKIVFATAVKACSNSLIFAHNHPSGNLKPSQSDLEITKKLAAGAKILDMQVLDHLILTPWNYYSMADDGQLPQVGEISNCIEILRPESS